MSQPQQQQSLTETELFLMGVGKMENMVDMVSYPPHYNGHPAGIEAIDVLRHSTNYDLGQAIRYIWRVMWGGKHDDVEDIQKAVWYLQDWLAQNGGRAGE